MNLDDAQTRFKYFSFKGKLVEDAVRERALLPVNLEINGIEVVQFNLERWLILSKLRTPFLFGGIPDPFDIGTFMWIVSPQYNPDDFSGQGLFGKVRRYFAVRRRRAFLKRIVRAPRWTNFEPCIRRYLKRAFMDRPATNSGGTAISAGLGASMTFRIMYGTYGGVSREEARRMPLTEAFQYLNWINAHLPQFRPIQDAAEQRAADWNDRQKTPVNGSRINGVEADG